VRNPSPGDLTFELLTLSYWPKTARTIAGNRLKIDLQQDNRQQFPMPKAFINSAPDYKEYNNNNVLIGIGAAVAR
jgi:hypothetical protein